MPSGYKKKKNRLSVAIIPKLSRFGFKATAGVSFKIVYNFREMLLRHHLVAAAAVVFNALNSLLKEMCVVRKSK